MHPALINLDVIGDFGVIALNGQRDAGMGLDEEYSHVSARARVSARTFAVSAGEPANAN